jgi:hypothetical protein
MKPKTKTTKTTAQANSGKLRQTQANSGKLRQTQQLKQSKLQKYNCTNVNFRPNNWLGPLNS